MFAQGVKQHDIPDMAIMLCAENRRNAAKFVMGGGWVVLLGSYYQTQMWGVFDGSSL